MRRPVDFWKVIVRTVSPALQKQAAESWTQILMELVVLVVYMAYGLVVFSLQGQYTLPYGSWSPKRPLRAEPLT